MAKCRMLAALLMMALICGFVLSGCGRSMNSIIGSEPSVTGRVKEVYENTILISFEDVQGYPNGAECTISLDVENKDSITDFNIGDKVAVYYNGDIAESDPMQISTVYAITLLEPADRNENDKG